ncbi:MAG: histone deacetylase [Anaerolineales bacterium]
MHDLVYFYPTGHEEHALDGHPERPERIEAIVAALETAGWWESFPKLHPLKIPIQVLQAIHTRAHLDRLEWVAQRGGSIDSDTYLTLSSWDLALNAAGGALSVASAVWQGNAQRGFALTRPPGHHATPAHAMGFCLLNNVALAAQYLIHEFGAKRLAIIDIDLHHGNGTQDIFYERDDVLFISTHQYPLYPFTGFLEEMGAGKGQGLNVNLPFPPLSGDHAFITTTDELILPILNRFAPEMILVSAGMDAHWADPLGHLILSAQGYGEVVARLTAWADASCKGRIALFLEGGYDLEGGAACATAAVASLLGQPFTDVVGPAPWREKGDWRVVLERAKGLWALA